MNVVEIEGLVCRAAGRELLALPSLRIAAGERVAIIGPNGAGKSTLLRCLAGFVWPRAGHVTVLGQALHAGIGRHELRALRQQVGQVMQGLHLVGRLTAQENVLIGALGRLQGTAAWRSWLRWYPPAEVNAALQALASVGLAARAADRSDRLSGGEKQRLAMARLLLQRPRLILADEPTASLDPSAALEVCDGLLRAAAGATLLTVVHNPALLPRLAQRVIGLRQGRCVFDLPTAAVDESTLAALYRNDAVVASPLAIPVQPLAASCPL